MAVKCHFMLKLICRPNCAWLCDRWWSFVSYIFFSFGFGFPTSVLEGAYSLRSVGPSPQKLCRVIGIGVILKSKFYIRSQIWRTNRQPAPMPLLTLWWQWTDRRKDRRTDGQHAISLPAPLLLSLLRAVLTLVLYATSQHLVTLDCVDGARSGGQCTAERVELTVWGRHCGRLEPPSLRQHLVRETRDRTLRCYATRTMTDVPPNGAQGYGSVFSRP